MLDGGTKDYDEVEDEGEGEVRETKNTSTLFPR